MIEFSEEQRRQVESGKAVEVADPRTSQRYIILRKDVYERGQRLLYDDAAWTADELRHQLARSARDNGWDEAGIDAYDHYDEERRTNDREAVG